MNKNISQVSIFNVTVDFGDFVELPEQIETLTIRKGIICNLQLGIVGVNLKTV
jgi:hypothetical protein